MLLKLDHLDTPNTEWQETGERASSGRKMSVWQGCGLPSARSRPVCWRHSSTISCACLGLDGAELILECANVGFYLPIAGSASQKGQRIGWWLQCSQPASSSIDDMRDMLEQRSYRWDRGSK